MIVIAIMTFFTINEHMVCSHLCCVGSEASDAVGNIRVNPDEKVVKVFALLTPQKGAHRIDPNRDFQPIHPSTL